MSCKNRLLFPYEMSRSLKSCKMLFTANVWVFFWLQSLPKVAISIFLAIPHTGNRSDDTASATTTSTIVCVILIATVTAGVVFWIRDNDKCSKGKITVVFYLKLSGFVAKEAEHMHGNDNISHPTIAIACCAFFFRTGKGRDILSTGRLNKNVNWKV